MGLLDAFLKAHHEGDPPSGREASLSNQVVEKVENGVSTKATNEQPIVITNKIAVSWLEKATEEPQDPIFSSSKKPTESTSWERNKQNVENVACVRGNESSNLDSLSNKKAISALPPVGSLARASNILNKLPGCDSCPACAYWDGYGRMGPGRYCFYSAYFNGKTAKPVLVAEAQKACQIKFVPDSFQ